MEFDSANSNGDLELEPPNLTKSANAVVEDMSCTAACEPDQTPCAAPRDAICVDDETHNAANHEERLGTNGAKHDSESTLGVLRSSRETVAAASLVVASTSASSLSKAELRTLYSHTELVKRCEGNKLYRAGSALIFSLGCVTSPSVFHTRRFILPFGFTSVRSFTSFVHPDMQCPYVCEILDGGDINKAHFRVTCIDDVEQPVVALSPSAAWRQVLCMIRAQAQQQGIPVNLSDHVNGLVMFGVAHPSIQQTLRGLTGSARCRSMEYFEHKTGYEDGADVHIIDASSHVPDARLLEDDSEENGIRSLVFPNNFLNEFDQNVSDIIATTPLSRRGSEDCSDVSSLPHGLSHDDVAHIVSVISADAEMNAAEAEVFEKLSSHVRLTSAHFPASFASPRDGKHDILCWWHMHEAALAAKGFSRFAIRFSSFGQCLISFFTEACSC